MKYRKWVLLLGVFCIVLFLPRLGHAQFQLNVEDKCGACSKESSRLLTSGPYATEDECKAAKERLPRLYCRSSSPCYGPETATCDFVGDSRASTPNPPSQPQMSKKQAIQTVVMVGGGAAAGCAVGASVAVKNNSGDQFGGCLVGAAAGALVGLVANKLIFDFNFRPQHPSPLIGRQPPGRGFQASVTLRLR